MRKMILGLLASVALAGSAEAQVGGPGATDWAKTPEPQAPSPFSPVVPERRVNDYVQIVNLLNTYWIALDAGDIATYASLFAPDAVLYWAGGVVRGREQIHQEMATFGTGGKKLPTDATERPRVIHVMGSQRIDFPKPNAAHDVGMWMGFRNSTPDNRAEIFEFGHYEDQYVKLEGRWYFQERRIYNERLSNKALFYPELGEQDPRET